MREEFELEDSETDFFKEVLVVATHSFVPPKVPLVQQAHITGEYSHSILILDLLPRSRIFSIDENMAYFILTYVEGLKYIGNFAYLFGIHFQDGWESS